MNPSRYALVLSLGFALSIACGDDDGSGQSIQTLCQRGCDREASLACPNSTPGTCVNECVTGVDAIPEACQTQAHTVLECVVNRPASDWECGPDGEAGIKEGVCSAEG